MVTETTSKDIHGKLKELIDKRYYSLLDVGCGLCLWNFECPVVIGIDVHRPYLLNRANRSVHVIPIYMDARNMGTYLMPDSISAVLFNDSLEHFHKQEALELLKQAERIAVHRVIVFTPRGYFPQDGYDYFRMKGEAHQSHRSGWEPEEFVERGYQVLVFKDFHDAGNDSFRRAFGDDHPPVDALLAWKDFSDAGDTGVEEAGANLSG